MAKAIVEATTHFRDADILAKVSRSLGDGVFDLHARVLRSIGTEPVEVRTP